MSVSEISETENNVTMRDKNSEKNKENEQKNATLPVARKKMNLLRPTSLTPFLRCRKSFASAEVNSPDDDKDNIVNGILRSSGRRSTAVNIVLVEAKGLPDPPADGVSHGIYCKFTLGNQVVKSKVVTNNRHPKWRQRFKMHYEKNSLLKISLWDKGKQKNFMGSCQLNLANLDLDRTHELWQTLDDGFGSVHIALTMNVIKGAGTTLTTIRNINDTKHEYAWYNLNNLMTNWNSVGQLQVKVRGAKGLAGRPNAYCILELDNERVQTQCHETSTEPSWNRDFVFDVHDVTSTLEITVYDNSLVKDAFLGRISIPLCNIRNSESKWFALKDKSKNQSAKGNCPRIYLEMTMDWNPLKATARMFRPREVKYIKKSKKFNIALVYSNVEFVRDVFHLLVDINNGFKRLFEWENREYSCFGLICWISFWYFFRIWMMPLLILLPFLYFGICHVTTDETTKNGHAVEQHDNDHQHEKQKDKTLTNRMRNLPEMTLTITDGIEYMASVAERFQNLATFKVPFLSYLTIILLLGSSVMLLLVPFNYLLIGFGIYKFSRKYLNPDRKLNNDIIDFINHLPDHETLREWKELKVPEPTQQVNLQKPNYEKALVIRSFSN